MLATKVSGQFYFQNVWTDLRKPLDIDQDLFNKLKVCTIRQSANVSTFSSTLALMSSLGRSSHYVSTSHSALPLIEIALDALENYARWYHRLAE